MHTSRITHTDQLSRVAEAWRSNSMTYDPVRFLKNFGIYAVILSTTLIVGALFTGDEKPVKSVVEFLFMYLFLLPIVVCGGVAVPAITALDWLAAKYFRNAHRLILVIVSALLMGLPARFLFGSPQMGFIFALAGSIYALAFRSINRVQEKSGQHQAAH